MDLSYIQLAIPVFFALIGVELLVARLLERDAYRFGDSIADLSCGILQQVLGVFLKTALFAGYAWLFARHRLFDIPTASAAAWVACFLGVDFLYYWFHRFSHEVNVGWAAHVVHHQSEEYNLTVALRQGALQPAISWIFYLPLALIGFPPVMFLAVSSFNTLYQFWIHTRLIGRLGPLEWVFNTPSHHRVHHGRNPKYIDRNHGGTLIVWDRLFGTFRAEEEEPVYGITRPLRSFNPIWANLQVPVDLLRMAGRTRRLHDGLRLLGKGPGWRPVDLGGYVPPPEVDPVRDVKYDVPLSKGLRSYVLAQFVVAILGTVAFLFRGGQLAIPLQVAAAVMVAASLASLGGLLDGRSWAFSGETVRLLLVSLALVLLPGPGAVAGVGLALSAASLLWLFRVRPVGATPQEG
jgi:sterol desaturase/sphingolipid hydroxylase (fatty acid hydroxylase superfamily)